MRLITRLSLLAGGALISLPSIAAEGMWTLDNLPLSTLEKTYGFKPTPAWLDKSMRSSVRLAGGCSGSFVSAQGLVLTNHHCVTGCIEDLSSQSQDLVNNGFLAKNIGEENNAREWK